MSDFVNFGRDLPPRDAISTEPDWKQADPRWIRRSLDHALSQPSGGWMVVDASRTIGRQPRRYRVDGTDYVVWRGPRGVHAGPDRCPHLGARLSDGHSRADCVVCPWHGLSLGPDAGEGWSPVPAFDDGVLVWIQVGVTDTDPATDRPFLPERPARHLDAVIRMEGDCEAADIVANRLDPWHGAHFHPYSFGHLKVIEQTDVDITVRVLYRVVGRWGVEVDARFHCPDPRTIAMTIVDGDGKGSVVETHATPIGPGRAAVTEATLATSDRPQFWMVADPLAVVLRPLVGLAARRLWRDDLAYAERRYELRKPN